MGPKVSARGFSLVGHLRRESLSPELTDRCLPDYSATRFPAEIIGRERSRDQRPTAKSGRLRAIKRTHL